MSLVGTGFSYSPERRFTQAEVLAKLLPEVRDVRRVGSAALDLCMVAAGHLDAYYEDGVHVWDWAAGALIAAEAGATVALPSGDRPGLVVASAPAIADALAATQVAALSSEAPCPSVSQNFTTESFFFSTQSPRSASK